MFYISVYLLLLIYHRPLLAGHRNCDEDPDRAPSVLTNSHYGIPQSRLACLFPASSNLRDIYVPAGVKPRLHLTSYRDLYPYTVCEGERSELYGGSRIISSYSYFLCPENPDQTFKRYCCKDEDSGEGFCCSFDENRRNAMPVKWAIAGGLIAFLGVSFLIGAVIYCMCCRCRRKSAPVPQNPVGVVNTGHLGPMAVNQPPVKLDYGTGVQPTYPHPMQTPVYPMPQMPQQMNQNLPPPTMSAWAMPTNYVNQITPDTAPPPYPINEVAPTAPPPK